MLDGTLDPAGGTVTSGADGAPGHGPAPRTREGGRVPHGVNRPTGRQRKEPTP
ncbi:hypothetical protein [Kitasatospora sp. NPDC098663]|uniref:hypothetical protein n=1 Tax=Kitasatospora sp. NPDC098663 TaxID=3364096 RepID=UPI00380BFE10